jgi:hypothetical protein
MKMALGELPVYFDYLQRSKETGYYGTKENKQVDIPAQRFSDTPFFKEGLRRSVRATYTCFMQHIDTNEVSCGN